eukprot:7787395-Alexandrium_andersonii.AAC.1
MSAAGAPCASASCRARPRPLAIRGNCATRSSDRRLPRISAVAREGPWARLLRWQDQRGLLPVAPASRAGKGFKARGSFLPGARCPP